MAKAQVSAAGDVAELVIAAPPLNLFDGELITDLEAALDELDALIRTRAARAVLLRAEGTRDLPPAWNPCSSRGRTRPSSRAASPGTGG